jgi:hypothetical protein
MQDMQEGAYPKKRRRVLLASLPRSIISQKRIDGPEKLKREDYGYFLVKDKQLKI